MHVQVDHIFILSKNQGREADSLVDFGWVEGSSRRHVGQGTINRKFYFENFFLEVLWIVDEAELLATPIGTALLQRSKDAASSRFGLCFVNSEVTNELFSNAEAYQPDYFPVGKSIDILQHSKQPSLPWTFRLPFVTAFPVTDEPTNHSNGIRRLTKATFGTTSKTKGFGPDSMVQFEVMEQPTLALEFDGGIQQKQVAFKALDLTIRY